MLTIVAADDLIISNACSWLTTPENVLTHLKNIYKDQELEELATTKNFLVVQAEGKRQVERKLLAKTRMHCAKHLI